MSDGVGEKIRKLRIERGYTLESFADVVSSKKAYIWQLENKRTARPSADLLLKIATALNVAPDFLLDDNATEPSKDQAVTALFRKVSQKQLSKRDIDTLMSVVDGLAKNRK
ncbi:HTH-type transcriptional regulator SinR [Variibacter gotjawalensis]|uniref:HTH-type transcriptional regulator SinR n=1 Tax=Variibacter gotjawalensis TaxID=1333996 RepID=A0A0S3PRH1_9BRAD|nr:helix-turn-helix transcriptional regulator [Variibacter gotjawalensis]NIK48719.1 transcriptional regulator with XRE-family HTH domain [Variibacter gotjawalensis]RZS50580.1 transcriptional regulator with XRE-family HTH domain [Variibacter gotjawalensis]BAT58414.1 HTH-type transcriptional regulator SinR [Variibacter gotjawalensis]